MNTQHKHLLVLPTSDPNDENDIKGGRGIVEKLGHDCFHANQRQNHGQQWSSRKCYDGVGLQHLQQVDDEHENLWLQRRGEMSQYRLHENTTRTVRRSYPNL